MPLLLLERNLYFQALECRFSTVITRKTWRTQTHRPTFIKALPFRMKRNTAMVLNNWAINNINKFNVKHTY